MKDIRTLVYAFIRDDPEYRNLVGATPDDARIYYQFTPRKVETTQQKPAYAVYYRSGTMRRQVVEIAGSDDQIFTVEVYALTADRVEDIADRLVTLWDSRQFVTGGHSVLSTYASVVGPATFEEGRRLFAGNANIYLSHIIDLGGK